MRELEKILEEIDETIERYGKNPYIDEKVTDLCYRLNIAKDIIRKHMNDGWIPAKERLPDNNKDVLVTTDVGLITFGYFSHGKWITDQDPDCPIAWQPLPEPYQSERSKRE